MSIKQTPFWLEGTTFPDVEKPRMLPDRSTVVVIGGGLTGLAAAHELGRLGVSVLLMEEQHCGFGVSSRNGGMVLTGLKLGVQDLLDKYDLELAERLFQASLSALDHVEKFIKEEGIDCDYTRCGHLFLASKPSHARMLQKEALLLDKHFNHEVVLFSRPGVTNEINSTFYHGGLFDQRSAVLNPARYTIGMIKAVERTGVLIYEHTKVHSIRRVPKGFIVKTARGKTLAETVFVAAGKRNTKFATDLRRKIFPVGSYIIVTEVLSEELIREIMPNQDRACFDSRHLLHYFRLTPDRRLLFGGRGSFFPETRGNVRRSVMQLHEQMIRIFPQLRNVRIEYGWGGTVDMTFDMMPHADIEDGIAYITGYAGHGLALASYLGNGLARQLAGKYFDNPFAEVPFPNSPLGKLYNGWPWFLPAAKLWYWMRDELG